MRPSKVLASASLLAALAACSLIGPTFTSSVTDNYDPAEYARVVSAQTVPVSVFGSVFGISGAPLTTIVVRDMTGQDWPPHARFTTAPDPARDGYFSVAIMINGDNDATGAGLCAGQTKATSAATANGDINLVAGLCRYDVAVSEISGRIDGVSGVQDPKFAQLLAAAIRELTPPLSTFRNNNSDSSTD